MCAEPDARRHRFASNSPAKRFCARPAISIQCVWSRIAMWTVPESTQLWRRSRKLWPIRRRQPLLSKVSDSGAGRFDPSRRTVTSSVILSRGLLFGRGSRQAARTVRGCKREDNESFAGLHQSRVPGYLNYRWTDDLPIAKSSQRSTTSDRGASHGRGSAAIYGCRRKTPARSVDQIRPRAVGAGNFHHRRHGNSSGAGRSERESSNVRASRAIATLLATRSAAGRSSQVEAHQTISGHPRATQSQRERGAFADQCVAAERLRQGEMVPEWRAREMPFAERSGKYYGHQPRSYRAATRMDRLARHRAADARALLAHGGTGERRCARSWLRRRGRDVALELRYAAGSFQRGDGPAVGTGAPAVCFAARIRAHAAGEKIWAGRARNGRRDTGAPAGKYVGAGLGEYLSAGGSCECRSGL